MENTSLTVWDLQNEVMCSRHKVSNVLETYYRKINKVHISTLDSMQFQDYNRSLLLTTAITLEACTYDVPNVKDDNCSEELLNQLKNDIRMTKVLQKNSKCPVSAKVDLL